MKKGAVAMILGLALVLAGCGSEAKKTEVPVETEPVEAASEEKEETEAEIVEAVLEEVEEEPETETETETEIEPETETETETEIETETEPAVEAATSPNESSIALQNATIDLAGLSTEQVDWGSGGAVNDMNQPTGCTMYESKYAGKNAYFLGPGYDTGDKVVYLTFDIGYTNDSTTKILDVLKEKGVHGVFFATKTVIENDDNVVSRIISEGNELANHSVTHTNMAAKSVEEQHNEIMQTHQAALDKYGYTMHLWRYPEGKFSEQGLAIVNNCNYRSVFWSFAHRDWILDDQPDVDETRQKAINALHPGAIYLLHGISPTNAAILGDLIDAGREMGYRFELLQ